MALVSSVEKGERDRALRQALTVCYTGMGAWDVGLGEGVRAGDWQAVLDDAWTPAL